MTISSGLRCLAYVLELTVLVIADDVNQVFTIAVVVMLINYYLISVIVTDDVISQ